MLLREIGEFGFIERLGQSLKPHSDAVVKGIGDDAAVVRTGEGMVQAITTDALVEGVDFLYETIGPEQLGHKALAINLSDLAAMGACPEHAVVTLCVPERYTVEYLAAFYRGVQTLADRFAVNILGGDISSSPHDLVISVTAIGSASEDEIRYRDAARSGDAILIAGVLGESGAGLNILAEDISLSDDAKRKLIARHLEPWPLVAEGRWLARSGRVHAMIDVSDGIGTDLGHVARASGVGAVVEAELLAITPALQVFLDATGRDPLDYLLRAGEDFALLFTVPRANAVPLTRAFRRQFTTPIHRIGQVIEGPGVVLRREDGSTEPLGGGFDHFRPR